MGIILWILFGALVGLVASRLMGSGQGLLMDIVIGVIGSVIGGWLMNHFGYGGVSGFNVYSFLVSVLGAIVFIAILRLFRSL